MGSGPIPATKIDAEAARIGAAPAMFKVCIRAMDEVYLGHINTPAHQRVTVSDREMSGALFDAVFG